LLRKSVNNVIELFFIHVNTCELCPGREFEFPALRVVAVAGDETRTSSVVAELDVLSTARM